MRRNYYSKNDNSIWLETKVVSIEEVKNYTDKTKIVFKFIPNGETETKMCVYWSDIKLNIGDEVHINGWDKKDIFLAKKLQRIKKADAS